MRFADGAPFARLLRDLAEIVHAIDEGSLYVPSEINDRLVEALARFKADAAHPER